MTPPWQLRRTSPHRAVVALLSCLALGGCGSAGDTYAFAEQCRIRVDRGAQIDAVHTQDSGFASDSSWVAQGVPSDAVHLQGPAVRMPSNPETCEHLDVVLSDLGLPQRCADVADSTITQVAEVNNPCFVIDHPDHTSTLVLSGWNCVDDECTEDRLKHSAAQAASQSPR